jgi:3-hydroxyacyl-CoA dehydrogenase/enoyl-CoA hydratase/3-hydroxybutyryl-CoA epimerase/enoyl-CoA isomerase
MNLLEPQHHPCAARFVREAAVLGAGIMGGGIAVTSALHGTPVRLKDIAQGQLDLGLAEARKHLTRQVKAGRLTQDRADAILATIVPQLDDAGLDGVEVVIEAVVENLAVKQRVLREIESVVGKDTVIATNTSSLRIDHIARGLARPHNLVGMHFFNPVPFMPLVEVIRGHCTSEQAVATALGYAAAMGKRPIVVQDCPGFLVNRILTAYVRGFLHLLADGADFEQVDRAMEAFGWPMGPAYLQDVVGMDTASHVCDVIAAGYPERMPPLDYDALQLMVAQRRFGQKNGIGFYRYEIDPNGRPCRSAALDTRDLLASIQPHGARAFNDTEIVDRMMLPLVIEAAHALENGVVATPADLDLALQLGIGFPVQHGGAMQFADRMGLAEVCSRADRFARLGPAYVPTARMRLMAARGERYHR